jgi:HK97 family phage prohead protease
MKFKTINVKYSDEGNGSLKGYASTWIRKPDSYGDIVKQGAFLDSLKNRWNGGKGIPFLWAHKMDDLKAFIGIIDAEEDDKGLLFEAAFDGTEEAQKVRQMYKDGRLNSFSFAYDILEDGWVTLEDRTKAHELRKLELYEISAVMFPANEDAQVVDVKSGRRNSGKDEQRIRDAISALQALLDDCEGEETHEDNDENSKDPKSVNPELQKSLIELIEEIEKEDKS